MCKMTKLGQRRRAVQGRYVGEGYTADELAEGSASDLAQLYDTGEITYEQYQAALDAIAENEGYYEDDEPGFFSGINAGNVLSGLGGLFGGVATIVGSVVGANNQPAQNPNIRPQITANEAIRPRPQQTQAPVATTGGGAGAAIGEFAGKLFGSPLTYLGAAGTVGLQVFAPQTKTVVKVLPLLAAGAVQAYDTFAGKPRGVLGRPPAPKLARRLR